MIQFILFLWNLQGADIISFKNNPHSMQVDIHVRR